MSPRRPVYKKLYKPDRKWKKFTFDIFPEKICYALGVSISELFEDEKNIVLKLTKEDYKILKTKAPA